MARRPRDELLNAMGEVAALPAFLRSMPLKDFKREELVLGAQKLRAQLKEVEDEIARRP